jgi:hypothetical protein
MATAGVTHDVTLNGQGFMLAQVKSGSNYVRESMPGYQTAAAAISTDGTESLDSPDGYGLPASKVHRYYFDNWRGVGSSFLGAGGAAGAGKVSELISLRPLFGGAGLGVAPFGLDFAGGAAASYFASIEYKGDLYIIQDNQVYVAGVDAQGRLNALVAGVALGAGAKSMGYDRLGAAYVCFGTTPRTVDTGAAYFIAGPTDYITAYANCTIRAYTAPTGHGLISIDTPAGVTLTDSLPTRINSLCVHDGSCFIGTDAGLYRLQGHLRASDPLFPNVLDQFVYQLQQIIAHQPAAQSTLGLKNWYSLTSFDGSLWGCVDGRLLRVGVHGQGYAFEVKPQEITQGWCWSLVVAANMLFASVQSVTDAVINTTIWAFDPLVQGWWLLASDYVNLTYLFSGGTVVRSGALMACHDQEAIVTSFGFDTTNSSGLNVYNWSGVAGSESWNWDTAWFTLPLITPDELAKMVGKQGLVKLLKVGLEWDTFRGVENWRSWPDLTGPAGSGNINLSCLISLDEGNSYLHPLNAMGSGNLYLNANAYYGRTDWLVPVGGQIIKPVSQIGQGAPAETDQNGNGWLIRFNYEGMPSPLIRRAFLDFQVLEFNPQIGNRWKLALDLSYAPDAIRLDGQAQDIPAPINFFGHIYTEADAVALTLAEYWSSGTALNFGDINGQDGHNVKIVSYKIERAAPGRFPALASDGGTLQQNYIMWIELVEVIE